MKPKRKQRICLCCDNLFMSEGPHNRLCKKCKKTSAYMFGEDDKPPHRYTTNVMRHIMAERPKHNSSCGIECIY